MSSTSFFEITTRPPAFSTHALNGEPSAFESITPFVPSETIAHTVSAWLPSK